jgi:glycosyltransferase involved in cell wall biosynthesis
MRIAQVAALYESVPPRGYGGTERVVSYLTEALVDLGHRVTLFATGDSRTRGTLEAMAPRALRDAPGIRDSLAPHVRMLGAVYRRAKEFDVIHCYTGYLGLPLARYVDTPTVVTLHGRLDLSEAEPCYREFAPNALISISDAQRAPPTDVPFLATLPHGIPQALYPFRKRADGYLAFVGRISPEKRVDSAMRVADFRLRIAAKVDPADRAYFQPEIRPLLESMPHIESLGEIGDRAKAELLGGARALRFPIDWPEPFGLVMIEALACGTPLIARRRGSVHEVLRDGVTGFLCEKEAEMVDAVARLSEVGRRRCREEFEARFSDRVMAERYLDVYRRLLARDAPGHVDIDEISIVDQLPDASNGAAVAHRRARRVRGRADLPGRSRRSAFHPTRTRYPDLGAGARPRGPAPPNDRRR